MGGVVSDSVIDGTIGFRLGSVDDTKTAFTVPPREELLSMPGVKARRCRIAKTCTAPDQGTLAELFQSAVVPTGVSANWRIRQLA